MAEIHVASRSHPAGLPFGVWWAIAEAAAAAAALCAMTLLRLI